ncbi:MAG: ribosome recycling factor [Gammaproteobacteria bacterium]
MSDVQAIKGQAEQRMEKSIHALQGELAKLRTGRAHASLLDHITVDYYGNETPLHQVASVSVSDPRTLLVTPWEKAMVPAVEKAILNSDLGLNPATAGQAIRVPMPPLTEERRRDLIRVVKQEAENARIAIRNIRRDANNHFKELLKDKTITEDDERRGQDEIQKLTDKFIAQIEKQIAVKEADLMEI